MEQDVRQKQPSNHKFIGLFLIAGGILLLMNKMGVTLVPEWVFTWPVLIIAIGFLIGLQHRFRHFIWLILIVWGSFSLVDQQMPGLQLHNYTSAVALILVGIFFIFRRNRHYHRNKWNKTRDYSFVNNNVSNAEDGEYIDSTSVFGGAKKVVVSKNFKGGDITCFMGGAEIDLTQADIQGKAVIDATTVFGGAKIIVPSNWDVKIETTVAFGSVEDKRQLQGLNVDPNKLLIIDGTAVFGGIEINNY